MDEKSKEKIKEEDFEKVMTVSGKILYRHIPSGIKRNQIINDVKSGKMSIEELKCEQKKMRSGKYLKYLYSEEQYLKLFPSPKVKIKWAEW